MKILRKQVVTVPLYQGTRNQLQQHLSKWKWKTLSLRFGKSKWLDWFCANQGQNPENNCFPLNLENITPEEEVLRKEAKPGTFILFP